MHTLLVAGRFTEDRRSERIDLLSAAMYLEFVRWYIVLSAGKSVEVSLCQ
jgi:hypothetical protein